MTRRISFVLLGIVCTVLAIHAGAQGAPELARRGEGPPPEIRALIEAFVAAFNSGSPDVWEAMSRQRFTPDHLARRSAGERAQTYERLRADFGTISTERVVREGPDAPLALHVKGTTGAEGVILLEIEQAEPFRITGMRVRLGGQGPEGGSSVPAPRVRGTMADAELSAALDSYLSGMAREDTFSGVVLVARHGKPVFQKAYGFADRSSRIPNTMTTRFNLGSINKSFTQIAIAQLMVERKLTGDAALGTLVPEYPQELSRGATVEQLLTHRAGIHDVFGEEFRQMSKDRLRSNADYFRLVSRLTPVFAPGARRQYCNGCYVALGEIIERVSGMPYERYIAENVFRPAGMTHAAFLQSDAIEPHVARGYTRRDDEKQLRDAILTRGAGGSAAGGAYATAADLLAFSNAVQAGTLSAGDRPGISESIAGGAPGLNAVLESQGIWTTIVLTNLDPPVGEDVGIAIARALTH